MAFDFEVGEVLLVNKPLKWTSFDVVNRLRISIRESLGIKKLKVGHAGTLDPLATGLLILCTGRYTKKIDEYQAQEKEYSGTFRLGATTPSFDLEHEIDAEYEYNHITPELILDVATRLTGDIQQIPPGFSAVLQRTLDLNAGNRPATANEMRSMIRNHESYADTAATYVEGTGTSSHLHDQKTRLMPDHTNPVVDFGNFPRFFSQDLIAF